MNNHKQVGSSIPLLSNGMFGRNHSNELGAVAEPSRLRLRLQQISHVCLMQCEALVVLIDGTDAQIRSTHDRLKSIGKAERVWFVAIALKRFAHHREKLARLIPLYDALHCACLAPFNRGLIAEAKESLGRALMDLGVERTKELKSVETVLSEVEKSANRNESGLQGGLSAVASSALDHLSVRVGPSVGKRKTGLPPIPARKQVNRSSAIVSARLCTSGTVLVIVGGERCAHQIDDIKSAFGFAECYWPKLEEHGRSDCIDSCISRKSVHYVMIIQKLCGHHFNNKARESCKEHGKILLYMKAGFSSEQIALQVLDAQARQAAKGGAQ
jgi:hypothetical protein